MKVFNWRTEHAGKPFWDTTDIGRKEAEMTIEELDALAAPQFPMVGSRLRPTTSSSRRTTGSHVVERAIELVGEDHVMLGSDFDGGPTLPRGMRDIRDLPMLTDAMVKRGVVRAADQEVPRRQPAAGRASGDRKEAMTIA